CVEAALGADSQIAAAVEQISSLRTQVLHVEAALGTARTPDDGLAKRLAHLEQADSDTALALDLLRKHVEAVAGHAATQAGAVAQASVNELRARVAAHEAGSAEAADRVHGLARMLGRINAQNADAAAQSEERLHKVELAVADIRLHQISAPNEADQAEAVAALAAPTARAPHN